MEKPKKRLPEWAKRPLGRPSSLHAMKRVLRQRNLHTVCESARCPNIGECFTKPTATFMILGNVCTRKCGFCGVKGPGTPLQVDPDEPGNIALTVKELGLRHVVVTSVTRDDLPEGGAAHFALTIRAIRDNISGTSIEVLTPDFKGDRAALEIVLTERPDIFNHNIETVPRLYPLARPGAGYTRSLGVLERAARAGTRTKSGIMVGLGESAEEVKGVIKDLARVGCTAVTIGQYLQPTSANLEVVEYVRPEVFASYELMGNEIGIKHVYSGTFVRSSYNAESVFKGVVEGS